MTRRKLLEHMQGREDDEMRLGKVCRNKGVLRMGEEMNEESNEIGEIHWNICLLEKDILLCDMNEEKLELLRNTM